MEEEQTQEQSNNWWDFFSLATKVYKKGGIVSQIIVWIALVLVALSMTGTPLSSITDRRFGLQEKELDNQYALQVKTIDLLEGKVMPKLDDILKRLENVEGRTTNIEGRVNRLESDLDLHRKTGK